MTLSRSSFPPPRARSTSATPGAASAVPCRASQSQAASGEMPCLDSESLLQGRGSVAISHRGSIYRLQATRQGKLILTK
jgi:hemin uptake protein HemP